MSFPLTLSVLMPVFNERATLQEILRRVQEVPLDLEIIVVDNCSTDGTRELLQQMMKRGQAHNADENESESGNDGRLRVALQAENKGKGASVRRALSLARGEWVIVQDADLEYDPRDYLRLLAVAQGRKKTANEMLRTGKLHAKSRNVAPHASDQNNGNESNESNESKSGSRCVAVFGTRLRGGARAGANQPRDAFFWGRVGLSAVFRLLYAMPLSDVATCYKLMRRETALSLKLQSSGFDLDFEFAAKLARQARRRGNGARICEAPIGYQPRGVGEGKKIRVLRDGWRALWALLKWRLLA